MEYYQISQDQAVTQIPSITVSRSLRKDELILACRHKISDPIILNTKISDLTKFPDILDRDYFLISESLKELFDLYDSKIDYRVVALCDTENIRQAIYFMPLFDPIPCLGSRTAFNLDRSVIKSMVLQHEPISNKRIFRVSFGIRPIVIVRTDVAESVMRRAFQGVILRRVPLENETA